jgi:hypothetical protein
MNASPIFRKHSGVFWCSPVEDQISGGRLMIPDCLDRDALGLLHGSLFFLVKGAEKLSYPFLYLLTDTNY